ncbi:metallophosphoesterase, partial [candidate division KSB1 bacterium]|nr:metallophosphoesterase [candidate division KSB1 bacterium]
MRKELLFFISFLIFLSCSNSVQKKNAIILDAQTIQTIPLPWGDNFERINLGEWEIFLDAPSNETTWEIEQGLLVQGSDIAVKATNDESYRGTHIIAGSVPWRNYSFLAWLKNLDDDGVGLIFRYQNPQNYYRFFFIKDQQYGGPFFRLDKFKNGVLQILQKSSGGNIAQTQETVLAGVDIHQDTIRAYYQDRLIFEIQDSTFNTGQIGFSTFANKGLCIDSVLVAAERFQSIKNRNAFNPIQVRADHAAGYYSYAIRGMVFNDTNGNGIQDAGETGIPNIAVSDGKEIVLTDTYGIYALTNIDKEAQLVFISIPSNYQKSSRFYYLLSDSLGQQTFNFPLRRNEKPDELPLQFIQITDIHVHDSSSASHYKQCLTKMEHQNPKAEFIIATGDLVETGSVLAEFEAYSRAIHKNKLPIYSVFGNHDLDNGLNRLNHYHQFLGPDYYSFDVANWHFVILNSIVESNKQKQWFENDLQLCAAGKLVLIFQHYAPTQNQIEFLARKNVKAIFTGHWHSNKIFNYEGLYSYNTPPFRFGGIDNSPAGYRLITLETDSIFTQFRFLTPQKHFAIASPAPGSIYSHRNLNIVLNVLNYEERIVRVSY